MRKLLLTVGLFLAVLSDFNELTAQVPPAQERSPEELINGPTGAINWTSPNNLGACHWCDEGEDMGAVLLNAFNQQVRGLKGVSIEVRPQDYCIQAVKLGPVSYPGSQVNLMINTGPGGLQYIPVRVEIVTL